MFHREAVAKELVGISGLISRRRDPVVASLENVIADLDVAIPLMAERLDSFTSVERTGRMAMKRVVNARKEIAAAVSEWKMVED